MLKQIQFINRDIELIKNSLSSLANIEKGVCYYFERDTGYFFDRDQLAQKWHVNPHNRFGRIFTVSLKTYRNDASLEEGVQVIERFVDGVKDHLTMVFKGFDLSLDQKQDLIANYSRINPFCRVALIKMRDYSEKGDQDPMVNTIGKVIQKIEENVQLLHETCNSTTGGSSSRMSIGSDSSSVMSL